MKDVILSIEDDLAIVSLSGKNNCINKEMRTEIRELFCKLSYDDDINIIIIEGGKHNFCTGGDIKEMANLCNAEEAVKLARIEQEAFGYIQTCGKPVIAAIAGNCLGAGLDLALACDFRFASYNSKFGFPEANLGIIVGGGGVFRLQSCVGRTVATEMLFTGRYYTANEALHVGLINEIVEHPLSYAKDYVHKFLRNSSFQSIRSYKKLIFCEETYHEFVDDNCDEIEKCFLHPDKDEGLTAFLNKRRANFGKRG